MAYLLFMAWSTLKDKSELTVGKSTPLPASKVTFAVFALYGMCAATVRNRVISRPRVITWMRHVFGGAFVALAGGTRRSVPRTPITSS